MEDGGDKRWIWEIRTQLAHQLEYTRILSIANDGYRGFERAICNEGG